MDSKEYGSPGQEVFMVYDWAKVPGVTNLYTKDVPKFQSSTYWSERFFNNVSFVGGVTDGTIGVAAMSFSRPHVALTYLKTWFFFDDVIVPLGSDITLPPEETTGESVITTLAQVSYRGSYVVGTEDGGEVSLDQHASHQEERPAWLHHGSVGYVFLKGDEYLYTSSESRTLASKSMDIFTAWMDHGPTPKDVSVAYAVLPGSDVARTRAFAADPDVEVITQTSDLHVVCHHPSKTVGAALAASGGAAVARVGNCGGTGTLEVKADISCLLLLTITSSTADAAHVTLTLADPQQLYDTITVQLVVDGRQVEKTVQLPLPPRRGSSVITTLVV
ncbi:chondroitinase-AC-like [Panulirus ornatus]|uniref:chondroitinase-AC-like n=1 Tax=Panulirus ornatus TaxID=150431 RepID=UPI003A8C8725